MNHLRTIYPTRAAMLLLLLAASCTHSNATAPDSPGLQKYSGLDAPAALDILRQRAQAVHNLSTRAELKLVRGDGQMIHLDALMVMARPDRLRLRAWKMGQAVFDLTLRPDGLWVETPGDPSRAKDVIPATVGAAEFAKQFLWFTGGFFTEPGPIDSSLEGEKLHLQRKTEAGSLILCEVDRATLTPRRFQLLDGNARKAPVQFTLEMSGYQDFKGIVWPTFLRASTRDGQVIEISLSDLEFNAELAPRAFDPPAGAHKQGQTPGSAETRP